LSFGATENSRLFHEVSRVIFDIITDVQDIKDRFMRWFTVFLIAVIVIGGTVMVYPSYIRGRALKLQEAELNEQILAKKREISSLMDYQRRFRSDPDFVEKIARQNHRVFPGELVFVFDK
jgi:cell division protein FtsB